MGAENAERQSVPILPLQAYKNHLLLKVSVALTE